MNDQEMPAAEGTEVKEEEITPEGGAPVGGDEVKKEDETAAM